METVLNKYNVKFTTSDQFAIHNRISSVDALMSQFLGDHYVLPRAARILLGLKNVLDDKIQSYEPYTQSLQQMVAKKLITNFYDDYRNYDDDKNIKPGFSIPTSDLIVIVQAWHDYLEKSPLKNPGY